MKTTMSKIGYVLLGMALVIIPMAFYACSHEDPVASQIDDAMKLTPTSLYGKILPVTINGENVKVFDNSGKEMGSVINQIQDITLVFDPHNLPDKAGIGIDGSMQIHIEFDPDEGP